MVFDERLEILRAGNVISCKVEQMVRKVISRLEEHWQIRLSEEKGGRMVTHLAMALMRIELGEKIKAPENDVLKEFRDLDVFNQSKNIVNDLIAFTPMDLPEAEQDFMVVNICLVLDA